MKFDDFPIIIHYTKMQQMNKNFPAFKAKLYTISASCKHLLILIITIFKNLRENKL